MFCPLLLVKILLYRKRRRVASLASLAILRGTIAQLIDQRPLLFAAHRGPSDDFLQPPQAAHAHLLVIQRTDVDARGHWTKCSAIHKKAFLEEYFASEPQINVQIEIYGPLAYSSFGNYD